MSLFKSPFFPSFLANYEEQSDERALWSALTALSSLSGDDANAKVLLELLKENESEHCVWNQANPCGHETLQRKRERAIITIVVFST